MESLTGSRFKNKKNMARNFSQYTLVAAFLSGMIFTAGAVQVLDKPVPQEPAAPEEETPGAYEPGFNPLYHPADYEITELAIDLSSNGFVTG